VTGLSLVLEQPTEYWIYYRYK